MPRSSLKNKTMLWTATMVAVFLIFIVWANYASQVELKRLSLVRYREYASVEASTLSHFFMERKDDLFDLEASNDFTAYFKNKALGMSPQYGLLASKIEMSELFSRCVSRKYLNEIKIYDRIAFINKDGETLVDNANVFSPPEWCGATLQDGADPGTVRIWIEGNDSQLRLILMLPVAFEKKPVGAILAWINPDALQALFTVPQDGGLNANRFCFITRGNQTYPLLHEVPRQLNQAVADGWEPPLNHVAERTLDLGERRVATDCLVIRSRIQDVDLDVVHVAFRKDVVGTTAPWQVLLITAIPAILLFGGGGVMYRTRVKNILLRARIEEAAAQAENIERQNRLLEKEVLLRGAAEEALRRINSELESRVRERTLELENRTNELIREVHERKEAEEGIRLIFNNTHDAIFIYDVNGRLLDVNQTTLAMFHLSREEFSRFSLVDDLSAPSMDRAELMCKWEQALRGEPVVYEWVARRPGDGGEFDVEVALNKIEFRGQTVVLANLRDISAQKLTQLRQAEHQEFLTTVFEGIGAALFVLDASTGWVVDCNAVGERLLGIERQTLPIASDAVACRYTSGTEKNLFSPDQNSEGGYEEGVLVLADAPPLPIARHLFAVHIGGRRHTVLVVFDITKSKNLERKLSIAQKLESIGLLAAGVAHEINTPIQYVGDSIRFVMESVTALLALVERYDGYLNGAEQQQDVLARQIAAAKEEMDIDFIRQEALQACERALEGVGRVATIVLAMKQFSHHGEDTFRAISLNGAIEDTITVTRNEWKYVADVRTALDPALPPVQCLPGAMNQVLLNVIVNAAHAMEGNQPPGGKGVIEISTRLVSPFAEIAVRDTGSGISKANMDKIFDPFFTTKEVGKGTGQGLTIVHDIIVDKHGGTIDVESEEGVGTTVVMRVPLEAAEGRSGPDRGAS